jgi:pyruvate dehydrogenase E2 component (dihydrolipoamide acetyltransferase)
LKNVLQWLFHDPRALSNSFVATAFQQLQAAGRQSALKTLAAALMPQGHQSAPLPDDWGPAGLPVKVIWGQTDRILPVAQAAGLPGRVALHVLPNVGHLPQVEAVDLVAELLTQQWHAGEVR